MSVAFGWLAAAAAALYTGGAVYAVLVEHPARLASGPPMGIAEFRTSHPRATRLQGGLLALGGAGAVATWLAGAPAAWLGAGALLVAVLPYSRLAVGPTTRRLLDRALPPDEPEARRLLRRWGPLDAGRAILAGAALAWMGHLLARG
ncbi:MAG TPA: DUF1772 domain-containing protein [Methylomirabilota bacterium]|nr:DUF1772 domain-containing protein [Methylomirabilota bacterium]